MLKKSLDDITHENILAVSVELKCFGVLNPASIVPERNVCVCVCLYIITLHVETLHVFIITSQRGK